MNLTEMVESIVEDTKQVVKRNEIIRRVRESITSIHNSAFFRKDIVEDFVDLAGNEKFKFSIPLPPLHRKFIRIAPMTALKQPIATTQKNDGYAPAKSATAKDYYGDSRVDIYHNAGNKVNIVSSVAPPALFISWYGTPEVADPLLETWLMAGHPQIFIDWAKARFYKVNGRADIARDIESSLYSVDLQLLLNTYGTKEEL